MKPDPELFTATLSRADISALAGDLASLAQVSSVRVKGGATANSAEAACDVAAALDALVKGDCRAVQLEYVHDGNGYRDTVMTRASGDWHLVRTRY